MKRKSESVNDKARALLDLIAPTYATEIPDGYLSISDIARMIGLSLPGAQNRMQSFKRRGLVDVIKVKAANGKISNYYGAK